MFITLFILSSCTKDKFEPENQSDVILVQDDLNTQQSEGQIVLGERLDDPYALKNMKKAYDNLKISTLNTPNIEINANNIYIRFLPKNDDEWWVLKSDTTILLFDFPLDYEIEETGTYYHDPSLPENAITWQYCVLPIGYQLPDIEHEIIYEVFIPKDDDLKSSSILGQFLLDLEEESYRLTDNLPESYDTEKRTKGLLPSKWTPRGTVKVWDNLIGSTTIYTKVFDHWEYYDCGGDGTVPIGMKLIKPVEDNRCKRAVYRYISHTTQGSYIPLEGARVNARYLTKVRWNITDRDGRFQTGQFRFKVNYAIKWERGEYDIRNGMILQAWYNGPKQKGDWNPKVNGGKSIMYATMHRAAHKQFYGDNLGIRRPTGNGKTKLCYINENGAGIFWGDWIDHGILPDIKVWGKRNGNYKPVDEIFATTSHELGHKSHWGYVGVIDYAQTSIRVYESWAEAVEWALTNHEYHTKGARFGGSVAINYECPYTNQLRWPASVGDLDYTPIFIDLMDNFNQRVGGTFGGQWYSANSGLPNDRITGYSLSYIQNNILDDSYGINSLRNAVKNNKIVGVTDANIDELFALYWSN